VEGQVNQLEQRVGILEDTVPAVAARVDLLENALKALAVKEVANDNHFGPDEDNGHFEDNDHFEVEKENSARNANTTGRVRVRVCEHSISHCVKMKFMGDSKFFCLGLLSREAGYGVGFLHHSQSPQAGSTVPFESANAATVAVVGNPHVSQSLKGRSLDSLSCFPTIVLVDWKLKWHKKTGERNISGLALDLRLLHQSYPTSSGTVPRHIFWQEQAPLPFSSVVFIGQTVPAPLGMSGLCHGSLVILYSRFLKGGSVIALLLGPPMHDPSHAYNNTADDLFFGRI
jgi:hypothetical protein